MTNATFPVLFIIKGVERRCRPRRQGKLWRHIYIDRHVSEFIIKGDLVV